MAQVKTIGEAVRNMSVLMANMYYHLTKAVIEDFGDEAKESFKRAIIEFGHERGRNIAKNVLDAGLPLTLENLDKFYDIPIAEGWDLHRSYENDMKMNVTDSCTFATVWLEKNWAEVGHIYCLIDIAIREGYSSNVKFCPVKNILEGDPHCQSLTVYCLNPKKQVEAQDSLCAVIEAIIAVKENFKADYIIDILLGKETSEVLAHKHEELEVFGSGMGEEEKMWNAVIRQALIAGYLSKDVENYGLLKVTPEGHKFLKKPKSFKIVEDNDFEEEEEETPVRGGASCAVDPVLYSMLKDLRKKLSKKLDVPPYVIFQDPSLEAMATIYPVTLEELQNIPGVGAGKAKRYGQEFCVLIKKHCEENEIERPEDLRVRTVANKSKLKVSIIQAIDRKVALDDIAVSKGLEFGELLDEVEAIVYSGTKLNIDYFLEEIMDEDHLNDIYDYFKESTTDKIDDAMDELGDDYTEDEIRLVRIKFISEMAN